MLSICEKLLAVGFEEFDFSLGALMNLRLVEAARADVAGAGELPSQAPHALSLVLRYPSFLTSCSCALALSKCEASKPAASCL